MHPKTLKPKSYFQVSTIPTYLLNKILQVSCHWCNKAIKIASKSVRSFSVRENWVLYELVMVKNKSDRLHNKGCHHKGQYNVTFFCSKEGWTYKEMTAWKPLLPTAKGLSFTFMYLLLCKESKFSFYSFLFLSFGKHHVVRKDLGTYVQLNMDSMSYYCWHHPWGEYVGRRNYKPVYFYVSGWNFLFMGTLWVLAIIDD